MTAEELADIEEYKNLKLLESYDTSIRKQTEAIEHKVLESFGQNLSQEVL